MINVLGVAFERRPGERSSSAHQAFALLECEGWRPEEALLTTLVVPCQWWGAADAILEAAANADAVILFGARKARRRALVAQFARNEAKAAADALGDRWPGPRIAPGSAPLRAGSLCPFRLARAMGLAGLPAKPTVACDAYVYNHCFYRLLGDPNAPPSALVRLPLSVESARDEAIAGHVNRMQIVAGVAAALCFAAAAAEARKALSVAA